MGYGSMIMMFTLLMFSLTIETGGSVSMCTNDTYTTTNYLLSRLVSDPTSCTCLLKSTEQTTTRVVFNLISLSGCRYKLGFYFNETLQFMSCDSRTPVFHTITYSTIKLNLEPYQEGESETSFYMNITSQPETNLILSCFVIPEIETTSTQPSTAIIPSTTTTTINTSKPQPTTPSTTEFQTYPPLNTGPQEEHSPGDDSTVGIAVGCFIGGIVFGIIAVLGLQWFCLKRQKKNELYSTPTNREDHTYDSIIPGSGVENINTTEETTQTSSSTIGEATVAPNSTGENSTSNPSVTYQNVSNKPYLNV